MTAMSVGILFGFAVFLVGIVVYIAVGVVLSRLVLAEWFAKPYEPDEMARIIAALGWPVYLLFMAIGKLASPQSTKTDAGDN